MSKKTYRITNGRYARMEGGKRVDYKPGDTIQLEDSEAAKIQSLLAPLASPPAPAAAKSGKGYSGIR